MSEEVPTLQWDVVSEAMEMVADLPEDKRDARLDDLLADGDLWAERFDLLTETLTEWMEELEADRWFIVGTGIGWQRRNGFKFLDASDGAALLRGVLPRTECIFSIYREEGRLRMTVSHHDAAGEVYVIRPVGHDEDEDLLVSSVEI